MEIVERNGKYEIRALGGIREGNLVLPSKVVVSERPKVLEKITKQLPGDDRDWGILFEFVVRSGDKYFLVKEYDWYYNKRYGWRGKWEEICEISKEEAEELTSEQVVSVERILGSNASIQARRNGRFSVVTEMGIWGGKLTPWMEVSFKSKPSVLANWEHKEGSITRRYWVLGDGDELVLLYRFYGHAKVDENEEIDIDVEFLERTSPTFLWSKYIHIPAVRALVGSMVVDA